MQCAGHEDRRRSHEVFTVRGREPLAAIAELMKQLDFEDLE